MNAGKFNFKLIKNEREAWKNVRAIAESNAKEWNGEGRNEKKWWQNDNNSQLIKKFCLGENGEERKTFPAESHRKAREKWREWRRKRESHHKNIKNKKKRNFRTT